MFNSNNISRVILHNRGNFFSRFSHLPWFFIFLILLISFIGILMMYSAANGSVKPWANKQIFHLSIAFPMMMIFSFINIRFFYNIAYVFYLLSFTLLVYAEFFGHLAMGAVRWINLGFFKLQPSDCMKLAIILALARYFHNLSINKIQRTTGLIIPGLIILLPVILIAKQPDLGTAIIILLLSSSILFASGVKPWIFITGFIAAITSLPVAWKFMHQYQKNRIKIFLNPESDPLGTGYNIMQSKIAIGSAGFLGKGFMQGSQSHLSFLPEKHTDFIFTMFAEEFGFIGSIILIAVYSIITFLGIKISLSCKNQFARILSFGCISLFFIHMFVNIAMVMGLLPVVGAPLPLLSYGGTIMITVYAGFGLMLSCYQCRRVNINSGITKFV